MAFVHLTNKFGNPWHEGKSKRNWVPALVAAVTAGAGATVYSGIQENKAAKKAEATANEAIRRQDEAASNLKAEQEVAASQAANQIKERRKRVLSGSKTIYTSPLGIAGEAATARKTLLGQ